MIQKHKLKIFTAAALALLILLCAPAAPAEQAGESAVNWDMTIQDMMALEGVTEDDGRLSVFKYGEFSQYCLQRTDLDYVGIAAYFFKADRLVMYGINIGTSMQRETQDFTAIFTDLLTEFTREYGEPATVDPQAAIDASNAIDGGSLEPEDIVAFAGWELDGDTALYHVYTRDKDGETIITAYINKSRLFSE